MSFVPAIPVSGLAGFKVLERNYDQQYTVFSKDPTLQREIAYFKDNISNVKNAADLVSDYRLMKVTLGAFGLSHDINSKYFIEKVLREGTTDENAFANKLTDRRYRRLAEAFGFDKPNASQPLNNTTINSIVQNYQTRSFEAAVGQTQPAMETALAFKREIGALVDGSTNEAARWFNIMGQTQLRKVIESALGLPSDVGKLDIDQQHGIFADRFERRYQAKVGDLSDPKLADKVVRDYLLKDQIANGIADYSPASTALTILQNGFGSGSLLSSRY
ncbi:DUF1217 domain-containing protein [Paracoccaceae bacterium GXU_MW_L88]